MSEDKEPFLERWSRLKTREREAAQEAPAPAPAPPPAPAEEAPPLPRIEELTPESNFRPFMNASVDPATRRDALKKLFTDAHFNTPDPFEPFSDDLTSAETISPEMLKTLNQAKKLLFDRPERTEETAAEAVDEKPEPQAGDAKNGAGSKDA